MKINDLTEHEIRGLQAIFPDIIKNAAPLPAHTLKKLLTIINDEQESRRLPNNGFKCGDIVRVKYNTPNDVWQGVNSREAPLYKLLPFQVEQIEEDGLEVWAYITSIDKFIQSRIPTCYLDYFFQDDTHRARQERNIRTEDSQCEHSCKQDKPAENTITTTVKGDFDDTYWEAYRADLAKELAIKLAGSGNFRSATEKVDYVISYATQIVDNLKKQSE